MIQVGGHAATLIDHEIPARYGLRQTIGDTLGVGGVFRALRTIPVMEGIAADMAERLPRRLAAQLHQPDGDALLGDLRRHAPEADRRALPLGPEHDRAARRATSASRSRRSPSSAPGVNHQAFILRFERDGEDLYPLLDEAIERDPELLRRVRVQMYRRLGYFPTESSEHSAEYLPWLMHDDDAIERYRLWVGEYVARSEENLAEYERTREAAAARRSRSSSSRATSTRRRSSTRSRPGTRG